MKNKKIVYSVLFLAVLGLGFSLAFFHSPSKEVEKLNNLNTPKVSAGEITIITPENKTYRSADKGYYPSTYGFEDNLDGTSGTAIDFVDIDTSGSGCSVSIETLAGNHHKVIKLEDTSGSGNADAYNLFDSSIANGTIEFYIYDSDASDGLYAQLWDSTSPLACSGFRIYGDHFSIYTIPDWIVISGAPTAQDNTWYHIRIDFECTSGGYQGLAQWDYYVWIDGTRYGPFDFGNNYQPDRIRLPTSTGHSNYYGYFDAIAYSWDSHYSVGDNLNEGLFFSYQNSTNLDWKGYSLDGGINRTIQGNTTIPMPSDGTHQIKMYGNDTMGMTYESDLRYFAVDTSPYIGIISPENKTYTIPDDGYYPAMWGFEDGNIGFDDLSTQTVDFQESAGDHKGVLRLYDTSTSYSCVLQSDFENIVQGTVEIWIMKSTGQSGLYVDFRDSSIDEKKIQTLIDYNNNGQFTLGAVSLAAGYSDNTWFHLKFEFDCTTDKVDLYINGNLEFDDIDFNIPTDHINRFVLATNSFYAGTFYVDALGYSWDPNHGIGDNLNEGLLIGFDYNFDMNWTSYSLDGGPNRTILGDTTIPMPSDGLHTIQVFGNDTMGTTYQSDVRYFTVSTIPPEITINSPTPSQVVGSTAPSYDISITGPYDSIWYTLDNGATNVTASGQTGTIDQAEWDKISDGIVTLIFHANNSVGTGNTQVQVFKQVSIEPPPGIPGYNLIALLGVTFTITLLLAKRRLKK